jgi:hypothetical protein
MSVHGMSSLQMHGGKVVAASNNSLGALGKNKNVVEEFVTIQLCETSTTTLLSLPSLVVASDTREVVATDDRNARYDAVVKSHANVDGFSARLTQTKNLPQKNQKEMAAPNALRDAGSQVTAYDIKDATSGNDTAVQDVDAVVGTTTDTSGAEELAGLSQSVRKFVSDTVNISLLTPGCLLDTVNVAKPLGYGELAQQAKGGKVGARGGKAMGTSTAAAVSKAGGMSTLLGSAAAAGGGGGGGGIAGNASGDEYGGGGGADGGFVGADGNPAGKREKGDSGNTSANNVAGGGASASSGNAADQSSVAASGAQGSKANYGNSSTNDQDGGGGGGGGHSFSAEETQELIREAEIKAILSNPLLLKRLHLIERAVQQNANHRPQLDYRDLPDIEPLSLLSSERAKALRESAEVSTYSFLYCVFVYLMYVLLEVGFVFIGFSLHCSHFVSCIV